MDTPAPTFRSDRHPALSYADFLDRDTRKAPEMLREGPVPEIGTEPIAVARYIDPAFARAEEARLWPKIWQFACREEEIPHTGDTMPYDIAGRSFILTRQADGSIRAFYNSCLHRGRKLATNISCKRELRCPYHGISWNIDGTFKDNPIAWDFPQWDGRDISLPQARIARWAGFVFINPDPAAPPFEEIAAPLLAHFERYDLGNCYIAWHVQKTVACNWKIAAEAFMESHHSQTTHPQILAHIADVNSQYDALSNYVTRQFSAQMVPSPLASREYTDDEIIQAVMNFGTRRAVDDGKGVSVPAGMTARSYIAEISRKTFAAENGHDYSDASDAEMVDALLYNLFPNFSVWAGYMPNLVYRWRPNGTDHRTSIMDLYLLKRVPKLGPRPKAAPVFTIGLDESMLERGPLAGLSAALSGIFEQDMLNLPHVQTGVAASASGLLDYGRYAEMRIRLMHQMIDRYLAEEFAAA